MKLNKKKIIYILAAIILIVISTLLEQPSNDDYVEYYFRNDTLLEEHYEKHGVEMGFDSMEEYEEAACAVIYNPAALSNSEGLVVASWG